MKTDTIAAISTAMSNSGIGIIRVSGDEAISLTNRIFVNKNKKNCLTEYSSHTIHYGYIVDENENIIDEVMISIMKAPNSYTTEDTVEINCHGGVFIMKKIMDTVLKTGVRAAEPGEFTKRAFLNGRIDLSEAEAVMDIINSKSEFALKSSVKQLKGSVSGLIKNLREEILYEIAFIESAIDDPEHISLDGYDEKLSKKTDEILKKLKNMLDTADNGKMLKEGINTVIVGKPNVGKSSLLNILVGEDKAIVTEIAGTTRDVLEETINLDGIVLNIMDTAGIRNTDDVVEKIGVDRVKKIIKDADLIIYVVDSSNPFDNNDYEIIRMIKNKNTVVLLNKSDLDLCINEEDLKKAFVRVYNDTIEINKITSDIKISETNTLDIDNLRIIKTSTRENTGIEDFINTVKDMFFNGKLSYNDEVFITNIRHKELINDAYDSMIQVKKSLDDNMPEDFYSIDLMNAYISLGKIIGEEVGEDLINEIFSKFCMGK
ncbi:MAG: tRNA uridine-5-carboxymethylaminomethyl(34) synthesis GTPase MnmE [Lachnospiraceae bacterium]|nr:tRNA uridine-5-carboxymethylaminomethyl(34) synthesis GTPase MnmE [Lachnospiraceae bacterium]